MQTASCARNRKRGIEYQQVTEALYSDVGIRHNILLQHGLPENVFYDSQQQRFSSVRIAQLQNKYLLSIVDMLKIK